MQWRPDQPGEALPREDEGVRRGIDDPNRKKKNKSKKYSVQGTNKDQHQ
jgi:hypothetical protein